MAATPNSEPPEGAAIVKRIWSAGGVLMREGAGGELEIVLCGRSSEGLWALPKGTPDGDEDRERTALREVREETGLVPYVVADIGSVRYDFTRERGDGVVVKYEK